MTDITLSQFEELIAKDEKLMAKAKAILGDDKESAEKLMDLAESLGYTLLTPYTPEELEDTELDEVAGGYDLKHPLKNTKKKEDNSNTTNCEHDFEYIREVPGHLWGTNSLYRCKNCADYYEKILGRYWLYKP